MSQANTKSMTSSYQVSNGPHNGLDHPRPLFQNHQNASNNSYGYDQGINMQNFGQGSFLVPSNIPSTLGNMGIQGQLKSMASLTNSNHNGMVKQNSAAVQLQQQRQQQQLQQQQQQQQQLQLQSQQQQQQMPFNGNFQYGSRSPYYPMGPYQGSMGNYSPMGGYPMYPMSGYPMGMGGIPFTSPTNIPVDGYVTDFGDFKIMGYDNAGNPNNMPNANTSFQNSNNMNSDKKFPMY